MLSDYEQMRLDNIRRNEQILDSLGLSSRLKQPAGVDRRKRRSSSRKRAAAPRKLPTRKSRRISGIVAPSVYAVGKHGDGETRTHGSTDASGPVLRVRQPKVEPPQQVSASASSAPSKEPRHQAVLSSPSQLPVDPGDLEAHEMSAYKSLLAWKRARAKELGYNDPCIICHNRTLCELVRRLPCTLADLHRVWGIGPKRIVQHGELMLGALEPFRATLEAKHQVLSLKHRHAAATPAPAVLGTEADTSMSPNSNKMTPESVMATGWQEEAGIDHAADEWKQQRRVLHLPCCDWAGRRRYCADVNNCEACARYVAEGKQFSYAPMSQRLLDVLASARAYSSHRAAHAAGWRWNASPKRASLSSQFARMQHQAH